MIALHGGVPSGPLFEKNRKRVIRSALKHNLNVAGLLLEGEIQERTPVGVGGTLRNSIAASGPRRRGKQWINRIGTPQVYGPIIEVGRRPNNRMPPLGPIKLWLRRKGRRVGFSWKTESELNGLAFVVARKIARKGFSHRPHGYRMFGRALYFSRRQLRRIMGDKTAVKIVDELGGTGPRLP